MSVFCKQNRVLELTFVADVSDNAFRVTAVKLRRDGLAGTAMDLAYSRTADPGANPENIVLGEALPQDISIIRFIGTIQA